MIPSPFPESFLDIVKVQIVHADISLLTGEVVFAMHIEDAWNSVPFTIQCDRFVYCGTAQGTLLAEHAPITRSGSVWCKLRACLNARGSFPGRDYGFVFCARSFPMARKVVAEVVDLFGKPSLIERHLIRSLAQRMNPVVNLSERPKRTVRVPDHD